MSVSKGVKWLQETCALSSLAQEQVMPNNWKMSSKKQKQKHLARLENKKVKKETSRSKEGEAVAKEDMKEEGEFNQKFWVACGTRIVAERQEFASAGGGDW